MARWPKYEPTIDESLTLSISKLKELGFIKEGSSLLKGDLNWSSNGNKIASLSATVETITDDLKRLTMKYNHGDIPISYSIDVVASRTNLGNSKRWYFVCPNTGQRCMKLICPNGSQYFYHRTAFKLLYESQKKSKHGRMFSNYFGEAFKLEKLFEELNTKYRKSHYRGKPTPLVKKIVKQSESREASEGTFEELKRMLFR